VVVNTSALPPETSAAELFGHARGAFTGAERDQPGFFGRAEGGTLFLDEIGHIPARVQVLLLRALDSGEIQPLGKPARRAAVRVIAATDRNLDQAVADGRFSQALFQRLSSYQITVAALRDRMDDFGRLLAHFLREEMELVGEAERLAPAPTGAQPWLEARLVARLCLLPWPGNVRELRNFVRQMVISNRGSAHARLDEVLVQKLGAGAEEPSAAAAGAEVAALRPADMTAEVLLELLETHDWRVAQVAAAVGWSRNTVYDLMKRHGVRNGSSISADEIRGAVDGEQGADLAEAARRLRVSERALRLRLARLQDDTPTAVGRAEGAPETKGPEQG
jgi:two-component system nitrogen regulation response regulator GlnG